ncbi:hypothetical protein G352_10287 [Rhodococcus ruber BKS 20-38]|uniref:Uncharacterized protein n=1 Tax=Rhodococcus ruber BKS 20-38 TaxID=1278076 RepID=M2ZDK2_9NOCA|nr:hypothetical protein [Rhodococcus ruber]EME65367.1 hypothetical protein G352_10287 [Rhodococcus ruber BKS 20-38]
MTTTAAELEREYIAGGDVTVTQIEKARRAEYAATLEAQRDANAATKAAQDALSATLSDFHVEYEAFISDDAFSHLSELYTDAVLVLAELSQAVSERVRAQVDLSNRAASLVAEATRLGVDTDLDPRFTGFSAHRSPVRDDAARWNPAIIKDVATVLDQVRHEAERGYLGDLNRVAPHRLLTDERRADYEAIAHEDGPAKVTKAKELLARRITDAQS